MKKIFGILICLMLLLAAFVVPTAALAAESAAGAAVTIHFLNPIAVAVVGDNLFVADNIDGNNSAIHCFFVAGDKATWLYTQSLSERIVNLSTKDDNTLYVVFSSRIVQYSISGGKMTEGATISGYTNIVDVTCGVDGSSNNDYILTDSELFRNNIGRATTTSITGTKSCVAIGNYIYYLYTDGGVDICKSYEGVQHYTPKADSSTPQGYLNDCDSSASNYFLKDFKANGLFVWQDENVAIFNSERICYITMGDPCSLSNVLDYQASQQEQDTDKKIVDVAASDNRLYILNDNYQVDIFEKSGAEFELIATVGDDTVYQAVPTNLTSFTLARPKGYPTNLVYKTSGDNSVDDIIKNATEYIILGYEGDADSLYYYVLVGNRFGWVQKSSEGISPENDSNLQIVNTAVSREPGVEYKTAIKFTSLNAVYIYKLPRSVDTFRDETFTQTASTMPEVTLLQRFTEQTASGQKLWYYVSFVVDGQTQYGFVQAKDLGEFVLTVSDEIPVLGDRKINSTLFEAVKMYKFADKDMMTDDNLVTTDNGPVKLYSGRRVTLLSEQDGVSFIQVTYGDGTVIYGYVMSDRLIGIHAITSNAIVGLSLLAVAIALATTLIVVFVKRKKGSTPRRRKENKSEE